MIDVLQLISGLSNVSSPWLPSSIPVPDSPTTATLTAYSRSTSNRVAANYTAAASACIAVIKNDTIANSCNSVASGVIDHFLEACIRDYDRIGEVEAQRILESTVIYYCATAMGVDECKFKGYFYFCLEEEDDAAGLPIAIMAAAGIAVILLTLVIITLIRCMKTQKNKGERYPGLMLVSNTKFNAKGLKRTTTETSFVSMDSRQQYAFDNGGRNSVISVNSTISFDDNKSLFKKSTVTPITVAPLTEQQKLAVNNWSKLVQKATDSGATSTHPRVPPNAAPTCSRRKVEPATFYISTSAECEPTSPTSPVSTAPVANWGKLLDKVLGSSTISPQFSGIRGSEPTSPVPAFAPNAPMGMFDMSPQPMFESSIARQNPTFAPDEPMSFGGSYTKPWKKAAPIPQLVQTSDRQPSIVDDDGTNCVVHDLETE